MSELPITPERLYTLDEYFALDNEKSDAKYEYRDGRIVDIRQAIAMAGGSSKHSLLITNTITAIGRRLGNGPCRVFDSNQRITLPRGRYYYPDLSVICGKIQRDPRDRSGHSAVNPKLIVEVLSASSAHFDVTEKFGDYMALESMQQYVVIHQKSPRVETYTRQSDGYWRVAFAAELSATMPLESLAIDIPLSEIYAGMDAIEEPEEAK